MDDRTPQEQLAGAIAYAKELTPNPFLGCLIASAELALTVYNILPADVRDKSDPGIIGMAKSLYAVSPEQAAEAAKTAFRNNTPNMPPAAYAAANAAHRCLLQPLRPTSRQEALEKGEAADKILLRQDITCMDRTDLARASHAARWGVRYCDEQMAQQPQTKENTMSDQQTNPEELAAIIAASKQLPKTPLLNIAIALAESMLANPSEETKDLLDLFASDRMKKAEEESHNYMYSISIESPVEKARTASKVAQLATAASLAWAAASLPVPAPSAQCEKCGTTEGLTQGPCPYASEIHNDDTDVYLCDDCSAERSADC